MPILIANLGELSLTALLGYAVVFLGLVLLMIVVTIIGKIFTAAEKKQQAAAPAPAPVEEAPAAAPVVEAKPAPGSAGGVKLYNVDPKTAAMLMAIVADKLQKPLNELRFISIKEVE